MPLVVHLRWRQVGVAQPLVGHGLLRWRLFGVILELAERFLMKHRLLLRALGILQSFFYLLLARVELRSLRRLQARPWLLLPTGAVELLVLQFPGVGLQVLPGLGALLPQPQNLLAFLVQLRHRLEDLRTEAFGD